MGIYTISHQKVETEVHKIIQYLAATANSFLPKKKDDSHINLKSLTGCGCITTRPLNQNNDVLAFSYSSFSIEWWVGDTAKIKFPLQGKSHSEVLNWIGLRAIESGISLPLKYEMHYQLPYKTITDNYVYHLENIPRLKQIMHYRLMAHLALEDALQEFKPHSEIRVWPHHFDIASLYTFNKRKRHSIGLGMALPDDNYSNFYLYVKGYAGELAVNVNNISELKNGYWNTTFNGAVLELSDKSTIKEGYQFFKEATHKLKAGGRV
ncbi:hypothetical protein [uncultured Dokdonia sp.]|uniref:hypothetical protein n=1 Tax=uncultured Dokdonia sp. TaxID=575653 RepID=UPI00261B0D1F|nr:hypothetical protein [uncultured Dokdonia sp.]